MHNYIQQKVNVKDLGSPFIKSTIYQQKWPPINEAS